MQFVGGLVPLLVIVAIIAAIVTAARWRREGLETEEEMRAVAKRLYFHFGSFVYMMVASVGVVLIARYVLDELFGPARLDTDVTPLALGVVLAVIWTPVWIWHRGRVQRMLDDDPAERSSLLRKVSVYLALLVTAALVAQASVDLLRWLFRDRSFGGYAPAAMVVWGALWALTWAMETQEGQPTEETRTVRRLYLYVTSAYSLAMLAVGASAVLYVVFREAYEGIVDLPVMFQREQGLWGDEMKNPLAWGLAGGAVWSVHWFRFARGDAASDLRQFYLHALAIMGGVAATLAATGVLLFFLLQWGIGTPEHDSAAVHFRVVPGALAPLLVGLLLWVYHWSVLQHERATRRELAIARRIYRYVMTALGLGAMAGAVIVAVPTVIAIIVTSAQEVLVGPDWWRDRIVLALTLGLLGMPVWGYHWYQAQRSAAELGAEERYSLPRRVLVFAAIVISGLAILGTVSHILFLLLDAILNNELSLTLLRDAKWSMGALVAAAAFGPYYWLVLREDWRVGAPAPKRAAAKPVMLLIAEDGRAIVDRLEEALDVKVGVLQRADPDAGLPSLTDEDIARLNKRIAEAPGGRVLLVADASGVEVYSYH